MYFDEDLMLDLRLNTLNDHVDEFIIAEATRDHAGNEKKLNFDYKNFSKFENDCIFNRYFYATVAQLVEQRIRNKQY